MFSGSTLDRIMSTTSTVFTTGGASSSSGGASSSSVGASSSSGGASSSEEDDSYTTDPTISVSDENETHRVLSISLGRNTLPIIAIIMVIDISSSMEGSRIGTVLHAAKAIVQASTENIYIAFQTFGTSPESICDFIQMTPSNKEFLLGKISQIVARGGTDLLAALRSLFSTVQKTKLNCPIYAILLTDGEPQDINIFKYEAILQENMQEGKFKIVSIDVIGVGVSLNKPILNLLVHSTGGVFYYITNETMVPDIFAYYFANIRSSGLFDCIFRFELSSGSILETDFITKDASDIYTLNARTIQFGQNKTFLLKCSAGPIVIDSGVLTFTNSTKEPKMIRFHTGEERVDSTRILSNSTPVIPEMMKYEIYKLLSLIYAENIRSSTLYVHSMTALEEIYTKYSYFSSDSQVQSYLDDLIFDSDPNKGQIKRALKDFKDWGNKYLWSLYYAYQQQITINDKDASTAYFSGSCALSMIDDMYVTFKNIPYTGTINTTIQGSVSSVTSTDSYGRTYTYTALDTRGGSCFRGNSPVTMLDGSSIRIDQLLQGSTTKHGAVKYVIKSFCNNPLWKYSSGPNFVVGTENHPIHLNGWTSLKDCPGAEKQDLEISNEDSISSDVDDIHFMGEYVYSLCIVGSQLFEIRNIEVATFGHGIDDDMTSTHGKLASTFWGTTILTILDALEQKEFLENGILTLSSSDYFIRDEHGCTALFFRGETYC